MAILTSAFSYLGSYYSEANPSLQGTYYSSFTPFAVSLNFSVRPETLYSRRPVLARQHGQADLQDNRESHNARRVRAATSYMSISYKAELATGWPIVSARAENLSRRLRGSRMLDSASSSPCHHWHTALDVFFFFTGFCTRWIISARRTTNLLPCSRRRWTFCSFCTPITSSTRAVLRCFRQAAHLWTHILLLRQWFTVSALCGKFH